MAWIATLKGNKGTFSKRVFFFCAPIILKKFALIKTAYYRRKNSSVLKSVFLSLLQFKFDEIEPNHIFSVWFIFLNIRSPILCNSLIEIAPHCKWTSWSNWWPHFQLKWSYRSILMSADHMLFAPSILLELASSELTFPGSPSLQVQWN